MRVNRSNTPCSQTFCSTHIMHGLGYIHIIGTRTGNIGHAPYFNNKMLTRRGNQWRCMCRWIGCSY